MYYLVAPFGQPGLDLRQGGELVDHVVQDEPGLVLDVLPDLAEAGLVDGRHLVVAGRAVVVAQLAARLPRLPTAPAPALPLGRPEVAHGVLDRVGDDGDVGRRQGQQLVGLVPDILAPALAELASDLV